MKNCEILIYGFTTDQSEQFNKSLDKNCFFITSDPVKKESLKKLVDKAKSRSNWDVAKSIAQNTYKSKVFKMVKGATHYHVYQGKLKCQPSWTHPSLGGRNHKCKIVAFIGSHVFLKSVD